MSDLLPALSPEDSAYFRQLWTYRLDEVLNRLLDFSDYPLKYTFVSQEFARVIRAGSPFVDVETRNHPIDPSLEQFRVTINYPRWINTYRSTWEFSFSAAFEVIYFTILKEFFLYVGMPGYFRDLAELLRGRLLLRDYLTLSGGRANLRALGLGEDSYLEPQLRVEPLVQPVVRSLLDPYDFVPNFGLLFAIERWAIVRCLHELGIDLELRDVFSHLVGQQRFLRAEARDVRALTDEPDVNRPLIEVAQEHAPIARIEPAVHYEPRRAVAVEPPVRQLRRAASVPRRHRLVADRPEFSLFSPGP